MLRRTMLVAAAAALVGGLLGALLRGAPAAAVAPQSIRPAPVPENTAAPSGHAGGGDPTSACRDLADEVNTLRREKGQLSGERARLLAELAAASPRNATRWAMALGGNAYHFSRDALAAFASAGVYFYRLPHLSSGQLRYSDQARNSLALTPGEEEGIRRVYADSFDRLHGGLTDILGEAGGDRSAAVGMTPAQLLDAIQAEGRKDPKHYWSAMADAHKVAIRERAGLEPPAQDASIWLRYFRLLQEEDERVIYDLDSLLSPGRAEQLLDDPATDFRPVAMWPSR